MCYDSERGWIFGNLGMVRVGYITIMLAIEDEVYFMRIR